MKKIILFLLLVCVMAPNVSFAAGYNPDIHTFPTLKVYFNGEEDVSGQDGNFLSGQKQFPKTMIYKGTTYVPVRYFSKMMGIQDIGWDRESKLIWVNSKKPEGINQAIGSGNAITIDTYMTPDRKFFKPVKLYFYPDLKMFFNGVEDQSGNNGLINNGLDEVPKAITYEETTYVPLRYFAVQLGVPNENIIWDNTVPKILIEWKKD